MLDALVGLVVALLLVAGVVVIIGPSNITRRLRGVSLRGRFSLPIEPRRSSRERVPPALNPKTQRVLVAAARLATWLRSNGQEDMAREIRNAAGSLPAMRRMRVVNVSDPSAQDRLKALAAELRSAVQDRFEQLELLPFRKP